MRHILIKALIFVGALSHANLAMSAMAQANAAEAISLVQIEGNQRIEPETVRSYLLCTENESCSSEKMNESLKKLFATGLFAEANIALENGILHVSVKENPVINKVVFEGNKRVKEETLLSELVLKSRSVYSRAKVQADLERMQTIYRKNGRYSVKITPKIIALDQNRVNLVYEIDEGKKVFIKRIEFIGNQFFSDRKLTGVINSKEEAWYRFFSSSDTYDADRVAYDRELVRKFYMSEGFADVRVLASKAEITSEKDAFILTFTLEEGERYNFGAMSIDNQIKNVSETELKPTIITQEGKIFNANDVEKSVEQMTQKVGEFGYAFVDINPVYNRDEANKKIDVAYTISEGPRIYINHINITGNSRTLDEVVRREFRLEEGDPFNTEKLKRSQQRIRNLGYFDKVDIKKLRTDDPDKTDLNVELTERSTGELNFGAGFSSTEGALANTSIRERNLLGKGQDVSAVLQKTARSTEASFSFTEPFFMDQPLAAGFDLTTATHDYSDESSFDSKTKGITLRAGYDITEHLRHSVRYGLQTDSVTNIESTASIFIKRQQGINTTSFIGQTFFYDRLNNRQDPTKGYSARLSQELAGLGGDSKFIRHEVKTGYYYPLYKEDVILTLGANGGYIFGYSGKEVRINERFMLGGQSLRGFNYAGVGPRDKATQDALGGNAYYSGMAETTFPLGLPNEIGMKGAAFVDVGSLWKAEENSANVFDENDPRASFGVGLAWSSPLGPVRVDVAEAFMKKTYDKTRQLSLNFGTRF